MELPRGKIGKMRCDTIKRLRSRNTKDAESQATCLRVTIVKMLQMTYKLARWSIMVIHNILDSVTDTSEFDWWCWLVLQGPRVRNAWNPNVLRVLI